jgi:hypothetical protein
MNLLNDHITIVSVPGKSYCRVEDDKHIFFIPSELCQDVADYVHKGTFEDHPVTSLQDWYLGLSMQIRSRIILVLVQKIA